MKIKFPVENDFIEPKFQNGYGGGQHPADRELHVNVREKERAWQGQVWRRLSGKND